MIRNLNINTPESNHYLSQIVIVLLVTEKRLFQLNSCVFAIAFVNRFELKT